MRFGIVASAFALALALAPAPLLAQDAAPATNTPATDSIGPRDLQDFTLNGTVTRAAPPTPVRPVPAPAATRPATTTPSSVTQPRNRAPTATPPRSASTPPVTVTLPPAGALPDAIVAGPMPGPAAQPSFKSTPTAPVDATASSSSGHLPWLLALLLLGAGAAFAACRRRSQPRYATAGGDSDYLELALPELPPQPRSRAAPPPAPAPQSAPSKPAPPQPSPTPSGIVSTRLRPWLEIAFLPGRCVVEEDGATIQFEVEVYNSGTAPAREVLVEASMFNAGPEQDAEIGAFFAHPVAQGQRIPAIQPLTRIAMQSAVSLTREQMRQYEVGGRRLFVPLVGFNALYKWSGGDGQTSTSYVVGRDTQVEKMAPLRLDLGPRIFRGLGARQHSVGVRT
ncbi:hypothetical protein [Sphingomonas sp.]|uniref:hypothetical protein n=1 Tax=Sphingomonas sp. TaxID=28214 RepID=UPI00286BB0E0|nr:hypothetical protein [Sphingomonas sp.]